MGQVPFDQWEKDLPSNLRHSAKDRAADRS